MYLFKKIEREEEAKKKAAEPLPGGPGFDPEVVGKTVRLEVWRSSFDEGYGPDFNVFRAYDAENLLIEERQVDCGKIMV